MSCVIVGQHWKIHRKLYNSRNIWHTWKNSTFYNHYEVFLQEVTNTICNTVRRYGKKEAGTGEHLIHFNNKINKHKWKAPAPHGRLPHTKHKLKSRPGPLSSSTVVTPPLTLPKLLRGTRDRWVVQVSFITIYSTGLAPFPRLSAPPHSPHPEMH